ncbi:MAG TPA: lipocalin-like domain-containing protein, partial [Candidatus Bathyarchaeia archaeon]|nr:lipocalin-like domain-containing protein [Candidatus Bathyarchaeia archaeon]
DVQNLMLGKWSTQVKYEPSPEMPNGGTGSGMEIWRPGPGGLSVIEEYTEKNEKGEVNGLGLAWWDTKAQGQRFVWCDSSNPDGCYVSKEVAKWDGASLAWKEEQENAGKKRVYSEVFRDVSPTTFTQVLGEGEPGEPLKTTVTIRATKVSEMPTSVRTTASDEAHALIGTWRVVEFADLDKNGKWMYWFGEHPRGYFVYDATGHVHIQIMKVPPLPPFPEANSDDGKPPTAEHALAAYNAYVAYFGTYTVDTEKGVVTHHVEGSLSPDYTDTDQPRPFKLQGDRLEIGDGKTWRRVLERVR